MGVWSWFTRLGAFFASQRAVDDGPGLLPQPTAPHGMPRRPDDVLDDQAGCDVCATPSLAMRRHERPEPGRTGRVLTLEPPHLVLSHEALLTLAKGGDYCGVWAELQALDLVEGDVVLSADHRRRWLVLAVVYHPVLEHHAQLNLKRLPAWPSVEEARDA